uniref:hypothetical protein n=1 Tax=Prevotella sp. TaxID=59823 RepID=UPI003FEE447B
MSTRGKAKRGSLPIMQSNDKVDAIAMLNQNIFIILQGNGIEEDHKHDYSDGDIPAFGWCHT